MLRVALLRPKLDITVLAQTAPFDQLPLLAHQILNRHLLVTEDAQVVADDMTVAAAGTRDERRAVVICLLGDVVMRAVAARVAGEG